MTGAKVAFYHLELIDHNNKSFQINGKATAASEFNAYNVEIANDNWYWLHLFNRTYIAEWIRQNIVSTLLLKITKTWNNSCINWLYLNYQKYVHEIIYAFENGIPDDLQLQWLRTLRGVQPSVARVIQHIEGRGCLRFVAALQALAHALEEKVVTEAMYGVIHPNGEFAPGPGHYKNI